MFQVNVSMVVRNLLQIIVSLSLMFVLNAALTGVLLSVIPIVSLGAVQYGQWLSVTNITSCLGVIHKCPHLPFCTKPTKSSFQKCIFERNKAQR